MSVDKMLRDMVADELPQAFTRALKRRFVHHTDANAVAGVVSIGHHQFSPRTLCDELIQQMVVRERIAMPDPVPELTREETARRALDCDVRKITPFLLAGSGVVNVADNRETKF